MGLKDAQNFDKGIKSNDERKSKNEKNEGKQ
jgi:hypothetical protein